jgi:hypothetical protein
VPFWWTEWVHDMAPSSPDVAAFLLEVAGLGPPSAAYSAWALPLLAGTLAHAVPTPSHETWLKVKPHGLASTSRLGRVDYLLFVTFATGLVVQMIKVHNFTVFD